MSYALNPTNDYATILADHKALDALDDFCHNAEVKYHEIKKFYPDLYAGGYWIFELENGKVYGMQQPHTIWNPDVIATQIELIK